MVNMGPSVPKIAESMAVAMVIPIRKVTCVRKNPSNDASAIRHMSPFFTGSFGIKSDRIQKIADAPMALNVNSTMGATAPELAMSLHSTTFNPNMMYAAAIDRCPFNLSDAITRQR